MKLLTFILGLVVIASEVFFGYGVYLNLSLGNTFWAIYDVFEMIVVTPILALLILSYQKI